VDNSIPSSALDLINLWGLISYTEPQEIMTQFTQEHDADYTQYDFAKFIKKKYLTTSHLPTKLSITMSEQQL